MAQTVIGLDIAYNSLKVSGLVKQGKRFRLVGLNVANTPSDAWKADELTQREEIAKILKDCLQHARPGPISGNHLMIALPELVVFSTTVTLPPLSKKELEQALPYEIAEKLSINVDDYYIDYEISSSLCRPISSDPHSEQVQPRAKNEKNKDKKDPKAAPASNSNDEPVGQVVFAAAAKKSVVESLMDLAKLAGLELAGVDIKAGAIARAIIPRDQKIRLVVDLGASSTGVNVVEGVSPRLISSVPVGNKVDKNNPDKTLSAFKEKSGPIFDELVHVTKFFENRVCPQARIEEIVVTGGGSNIKGAAELIQQETGLPTVTANSMLWIDSPRYPIPPEITASFADSFGLAMRDFK